MVDLSLKQTKTGYSIKLKTSPDVEAFMRRLGGPPQPIDPYTHVFRTLGTDLMAHIQIPRWLDGRLFNQFNRPFDGLSLFQLAGISTGLTLRPRQGTLMPFEMAVHQVDSILQEFNQFYQFFRRNP